MKVYKSRVNEDGFGKLGESAVTHSSKEFMPQTDDTLRSSLRHPIVPLEKTLVGNTAKCQSDTTNRLVFPRHGKITRDAPIIHEGELKLDPRATFYDQTTNAQHFDKDTFTKAERAVAVEPDPGIQTNALLHSNQPVRDPYDLKKPCIDQVPRLDSRSGMTRVVRPNGLTPEKLNEIRANLRSKNIGPVNSGTCLKPGSRMTLRTTSMAEFHEKSVKRAEPIIPQENNALKYPGRISENTAARENFARPASSCYAYEDFYVYC